MNLRSTHINIANTTPESRKYSCAKAKLTSGQWSEVSGQWSVVSGQLSQIPFFFLKSSLFRGGSYYAYQLRVGGFHSICPIGEKARRFNLLSNSSIINSK